MKYIFFLGRVGELSVAEIDAMLQRSNIQHKIILLFNDVAIVDSEKALDTKEMLVQMGGTIKISELNNEFKNIDDLLDAAGSAVSDAEKNRKGKITVGYNVYFSPNTDKNKVQNALSSLHGSFSRLKKRSVAESSMRIVYPDKNGRLNSASVLKNKFIDKGIAFDIIFFDDKIILSKISAIQDIDSYSERDFGRPHRDAKIGMTPPKLAQIMINLARLQEGAMVYDPFCGVGTIMQEALLNDYRATGSDADGGQVANCKLNLDWISKKYILKYPDFKVFQSDSAHAFKKIRENSIDAIITETTLGPVYSRLPSSQEIRQNFKKIEKIYLRFFQNSKVLLRNKGKIVFMVPAYQISHGEYIIAPFIDNIEKIGYSNISLVDKGLFIGSSRITKRNTIIYSRPNQFVAREVIVFQKK